MPPARLPAGPCTWGATTASLGSIRGTRRAPLGAYAFQAVPAALGEERRAVPLEVIDVVNRRRAVTQHRRQGFFAPLAGDTAQVEAVEIEQVEGEVDELANFAIAEGRHQV